MKFYGITPTDILLPKSGTDMKKWSVVACDQYTSEPEYWRGLERLVGDAPSTLKLIFPEAFLSDGDRTEAINAEMRKYLADGTLTTAVRDGFVLTERTTASGKRLGLVAALDLEEYDFCGKPTLTRATEQTVAERIPPRVKIRRNAPLDLPHVMVLADDTDGSLNEALYERRDGMRRLYSFTLNADGGSIAGYAVESEDDKRLVSEALEKLCSRSNGFLFAVGDGNHSLATAKTCYEELKKELPEDAAKARPERYALVEIVNLYSPALIFEPIHRVMFGANADEFISSFAAFAAGNGAELTDGDDFTFVWQGGEKRFGINDPQGRLPLALLQEHIDLFIKKVGGTVDYIHGDTVAEDIGRRTGNFAVLLRPIKKQDLFSYIRAGGSLPRKTFSMGEANEKRYYLEARRLK